jgi:papain like protease
MASNAADVIAFLVHRGPGVLGTDWYESRFDPVPDGLVKVAGNVAGGHAYLCYGYDADGQRFRGQNSWGRAWGDNGRFWVARGDLDRLIRAYGEACGALELAGVVRA